MKGKRFIAAGMLAAVSLLPFFASAFSPPETPPLEVDLDIHGLIDIILGVFWSFTVVLVIFYFIAIGFLFISSRGDAERLVQAQLALRIGFIGVVIILVAFSIVSIVRNTIGI